MNSIYTDGSCLGNPGPGGWAIYSKDILVANAAASVDDATNSRMELRAILEALRIIPPGTSTIIYSDSTYAVQACLNSKFTANADLIISIRRYLEKLNRNGDVSVVWQPRDSSEGNKIADLRARSKADEAKRRRDAVRIRNESRRTDLSHDDNQRRQ